jgi:hypothetical protein
MLAVPGAALAVLLGFALHAEVRYRRRASAIRALQEAGEVGFGKPRPPTWISRLLGPQAQSDLPVVWVKLRRRSAAEAMLANVAWIAEIESLSLGGSAVTDAGLAHIRSLANLDRLGLYGTGVTDVGVAHLRGLTNLRRLALAETAVTDAGLAHLAGLTGLQYLYLGGTHVTDAGLMHVGGLTELRRLSLEATRVTDAGLTHLGGLANLEELDLSGASRPAGASFAVLTLAPQRKYQHGNRERSPFRTVQPVRGHVADSVETRNRNTRKAGRCAVSPSCQAAICIAVPCRALPSPLAYLAYLAVDAVDVDVPPATRIVSA